MNAYLSLGPVGSAFIETRNEWVGFGMDRHPRGDRELFLGYLQVTYSPPNHEGWSKKPLISFLTAASLGFLLGTGVITTGGIWLPIEQEAVTPYIPQLTSNPSLDILIRSD